MEGRGEPTVIPVERIEEVLPAAFRSGHSDTICPSRA